MRKLDTVPAQESTPDVHDELITIEAPTVEEAMNRLATEVGDDARIVSAEKTAKGGLGGFFAKEMVVITARRPEHDRSGLPGVLERMTEDADLKERSFGDVLQRQLEDRTASAGLGSFLDAAGWSPPSALPAVDAKGVESGADAASDNAASDNSASHNAASHNAAPDKAADSVSGADAGNEAPPPAVQLPTPGPVTVGPMAAATSTPWQSASMPEASIAERMASEHLVMTPLPAAANSGIVVPGLTAAMDALDLAPSDLGSGGRLHPAPNVASAAPTPAHVDDAHADAHTAGASANAPDLTDAPLGLGIPSWNVTELVRHGLPSDIVNAVRGLDPNDDLAWINAVATAVAPWCGPLPAGDRVIVGTGADRLAESLELPLVHLGDVAPYAGTFCSVLTGAEDDRAWLDFVRGGRHLHFVLGEDELWRDLLVADPAVVSWVSPSGLIDALYLASTLGSTLGFGSLAPEAPLLRAQPVDVALGLRTIVGRN